MTARAKLVFSLALLLGAAGCFVDDTLEGSSGPSAVPCTKLDDCVASDSPCVELTCSDGFCGAEPIPDGVGPLVNSAGDCRKLSCVSGEVVDAVDDSDRDDGNPCTEDDCEAGKAEHNDLPTGAPCLIGASVGSCNGQQDCIVSCAPGDPCPPHEPCARWDCVQGICERDGLNGEPMSPLMPLSQTFGDCKRWTCVDGVAEEVDDDDDLPITHQVDCVSVSCAGGTLTEVFRTMGEVCGSALTCDALSQCGTCDDPLDCEAPAVECRIPVCNAGFCAQDPEPEGTACMSDTGICRADGVCVECLVDGDCEPDTGTVCATNECVENTCVRVGAVDLTLCGNGVFCSEGACVQCVSEAQCDDGECCGTGGVCKDEPCN